MKKWILGITVCLMTVFLCGMTVSAEETEPSGETNEMTQGTQLAQDFEENIVPLIMSAAGAIGGVLIAFGMVVSAVNKVKKAFAYAKKSMDEAKDNAALKAGENERLNAVISLQNEKILSLTEKQDKILAICKIAFLNSPELVKSGYAMEIAKVVEDEERETKTADEA